MDCFDVVSVRYDLNFYEALKHINKTFKLGLNGFVDSTTIIQPKRQDLLPQTRKTIQAIPKAWSKASLAYWAQYGIDEDFLNESFIYDTKTVYTDHVLVQRATEKNPIFTYLFPPSTHIKVYRPYCKERKWRSNTSNEDIDGLHNLPKKGKLLIITSSRKDRMVLNTMGFSAVSPSTSEHALLDEDICKKLKKRFKHILVFMDADSAGDKAAYKYFDKRGFNSISIPLRYKTKDISDFRSRFKHKKTYKSLKKMIKNHFNKRNIPF
jgi:hypothetical protein